MQVSEMFQCLYSVLFQSMEESCVEFPVDVPSFSPWLFEGTLMLVSMGNFKGLNASCLWLFQGTLHLFFTAISRCFMPCL